MAAADTACVIALSAARGGFGPMTTVQQSAAFQRAVLAQDLLVHARITKLGRRIAFLDITLTPDGAESPEDTADPAAHATAVYALG